MDRLAAMDAFIRVVDSGSFSGAAKQLRMGQPIVQLEQRLSARLLLRTTRRLTPTEAAGIFTSTPNGPSTQSGENQTFAPDFCAR
jgi:DNA-binding transcriptional LysR family regulator